jgi:trans-aconitate 2-methyltransferase
MEGWDPQTYLRFAEERTQPAKDLAARIRVASPGRVVDLGCGPGNSTGILHARWPQAKIAGIDQSPEMIEAASRSYPDGRWVLGDIATWTAESPCDVVFSNAALQWVPDHARLIPRLFSQVAPGGVLAFQVPALHDSPHHQTILRVAEDPAWRHLMDGPKNVMTRETPAFYYDLLRPLASHLEMWETIYYHVLDGPEVIVHWFFRGTGLRPFLAALETDAQRASFEEKLLDEFTRSHPRRTDGRVLFAFRRLFVAAYRGT